MKKAIAVIAILGLLMLAVYGGIGYIIVHFIHKFWQSMKRVDILREVWQEIKEIPIEIRKDYDRRLKEKGSSFYASRKCFIQLLGMCMITACFTAIFMIDPDFGDD